MVGKKGVERGFGLGEIGGPFQSLPKVSDGTGGIAFLLQCLSEPVMRLGGIRFSCNSSVNCPAALLAAGRQGVCLNKHQRSSG